MSKEKAQAYNLKMKRSKKIFLIIAAVFLLIMVVIGIDISRRTTFPGSKPQLKERIFENEKSTDSLSVQDSL